MNITEQFIKEILVSEYPDNYQKIYDNSLLIQYLDKKMKAVHGNSKTRRSLANIYAIYSILYFYSDSYYNKPDEYHIFLGFYYMLLFNFYRTLYGGSKLQNHALNSRVNGEFKNKFTDIKKVAYPKFQEKLSICRDLLHEYDYSAFFSGNELTAGKTITGAVNFLMDRTRERDRESYTKEALLLKQALSLCSSIAEESERNEAAFFEAIRVLLMRILNQGSGKKLSLLEINAKINELLKQSVKSDGVINLFSDKEQDFSLFDPKFLEEISKMKEKNLAVELLKRLIAEQVHIYRRTNLVKSEKFSEIMQSAMNRYLNGMLTNEEVIQERAKLLAEKAKKIWAFPDMTDAELEPYRTEEKTFGRYSLESYDINVLIKTLFDVLDRRIQNLSSSVKREFKKLYVAYKLDTNFVDIVFQKQRLRISVNMKFSEVSDPKGICKDITGVGRWGNGDVELYMEHTSDVDQVMEIVEQSFKLQADE